MIYMLLFRESVFVMQRKPHSAHHLQRTGLSALHTCRQIHEEVRLVPFSVATFSFYNPEHLRNWLKIQNISSEKSSAISRLELDYYAYWGISQTNGFLWQPDSVIPDWWTSSGIAVKTLLPSLRHTKMFFSFEVWHGLIGTDQWGPLVSREALFADTRRVFKEMRDLLERGNPGMLATTELETEFEDHAYGPLHGYKHDAERKQYRYW